ncbi:MAG: dihydropteroate synthase [Deltaproteobacteria bacterium]|nr:dihydropteroate synthase [Deltaproteobacteria bacterium]
MVGDKPGRPRLVFGGRELDLSRPLVMGVVNVTPDSFSDGGRNFDPGIAVANALRLVQEGADLLDVGGESTRPGSEPVLAAEELRRVLPVIEALASRVAVPISIDTTKAEVAARAAAAGATIANDVSGLRFEPELADVARERGMALVLMHSRGRPKDMQRAPSYEDTVGEVVGELGEALERASARGVPREATIVDPGIGFAKRPGDNLVLLGAIPRLRAALARPVLVGPSRKAFLGVVTGAPVDRRGPGTLAAVAVAVYCGAEMVRVHDVAEARQAADVAAAIRDGRPAGGPRCLSC